MKPKNFGKNSVLIVLSFFIAARVHEFFGKNARAISGGPQTT
jgi:hypothetical protein